MNLWPMSGNPALDKEQAMLPETFWHPISVDGSDKAFFLRRTIKNSGGASVFYRGWPSYPGYPVPLPEKVLFETFNEAQAQADKLNSAQHEYEEAAYFDQEYYDNYYDPMLLERRLKGIAEEYRVMMSF